MNRRTLLVAGGVGGAGLAGAGAFLWRSGEGGDPDAGDDPDDQQTYAEYLDSLDVDDFQHPEPLPAASFEYEPVEGEAPSEPLVEAVEARPSSDAAGDRVTLWPGEVAATTVAETMLLMLLDEVDVETVTSVDDSETTFVGGSHAGVTALVATADRGGESAVLLARGADEATAVDLADDWS